MDPKIIHLRQEIIELKMADDNIKRLQRLWNAPGYTGRRTESSDFIHLEIHAMTEYLDVLGLVALILKDGGESAKYIKSRDFVVSIPWDHVACLTYYVNRGYILRNKPDSIRDQSVLAPALSTWRYTNVTVRGRHAIDEVDLLKASIILENRLLEPSHRD